MSRTLTAEETAALQKSTMTLAACWTVTDRHGNTSRHTSHDADITCDKGDLAGLYSRTKPVEGSQFVGQADLAVDNLEITVPLDTDGITLGAIRAGAFGGMRFKIFLTDWQAPHNVGIVLQRGVIGNVRLATEHTAVFELRSIKQLLQQNIVPLVSRTCRVKLGSSLCGVNLADYTVPGHVSSIGTQRRIFTAADLLVSPTFPDGWFNYGAITWLTGSNADLQMDVKNHTGGQLELIRPMPFNIAVGDSFTVTAGCDHSRDSCKDKFHNLINMQAEPDAQDVATLVSDSPTL